MHSLPLLLTLLDSGPLPPPPPLHRHASAPRIYGGEVVPEGEWLQVAFIEIGVRQCTATLVSPTVLLTAAHCVPPGAEPSDALVRFGSDASAPAGILQVTEFAVHPEYCAECSKDRMDFAYLRLASEVFLPPLALVETQEAYDQLLADGAGVTLMGYGLDETGTSGIKRTVDSQITGYLAGGREFSAGDDGKDSCQGDSGGPALVFDADGAPLLAGVLSRGYECGDGGIYGNPYTAACWLNAETGVTLAPSCTSCDCVDLSVHLEEGGCGCEVRPGRGGPVASLLLLLLGVVRRRRAERASTPPCQRKERAAR